MEGFPLALLFEAPDSFGKTGTEAPEDRRGSKGIAAVDADCGGILCWTFGPGTFGSPLDEGFTILNGAYSGVFFSISSLSSTGSIDSRDLPFLSISSNVFRTVSVIFSWVS